MADNQNENEVDDEFRSILEGLRTTLPGAQVLFAFLLTLPLQASFGDISTAERASYYIAFFGAAMASVLLIAPSAHQRIRAPISGIERHSRRHLRFTVAITIVGTVVLAVALAAAVFLISSLTLTTGVAIGATVVVSAVVAWSWFYVPLVSFQRG